MAQTIKTIVAEHGIQMAENVPLAREVQIGQAIKAEWFNPVAEILAAVYRLRRGAAQVDWARKYSDGRQQTQSNAAVDAYLDPQPVRLPILDLSLNSIGRVEILRKAFLHQCRQLGVAGEPQAHQLRYAQLGDIIVAICWKHPDETQAHLQTDDAILGHDDGCAQEQRNQR